APWLADRRTREAFDLVASSPRDAAAKARSAHELDPLSIQALWTLASAEAAAGDDASARERHETAVRIEPQNPETWYELGCFALSRGRDVGAAAAFLEQSDRLDPSGPAAPVLAELDAALVAGTEPPVC
ncbi:MAG: hypothetical protein M3M94_05620, partial [Actinomycetota bacterium]|nr:hypothetical protein [Actinomycetota bacterium]